MAELCSAITRSPPATKKIHDALNERWAQRLVEYSLDLGMGEVVIDATTNARIRLVDAKRLARARFIFAPNIYNALQLCVIAHLASSTARSIAQSRRLSPLAIGDIGTGNIPPHWHSYPPFPAFPFTARPLFTWQRFFDRITGVMRKVSFGHLIQHEASDGVRHAGVCAVRSREPTP